MADPGADPAAPSARLPSALYVLCPTEGEETLHQVLRGQMGTRGGLTLNAVVRCRTCGTTHQVTLREAGDREVAFVVSREGASHRTRVPLPEDDVLKVGDELLVEGREVIVTALELPDGRRRPQAAVAEVATVWAKDHEAVILRTSVHLGKKTVAKERRVAPEQIVTVGDRVVFGRLRCRVVAIKTHDRRLKHRGDTAIADDIVRVYAEPEPE